MNCVARKNRNHHVCPRIHKRSNKVNWNPLLPTFTGNRLGHGYELNRIFWLLFNQDLSGPLMLELGKPLELLPNQIPPPTKTCYLYRLTKLERNLVPLTLTLLWKYLYDYSIEVSSEASLEVSLKLTLEDTWDFEMTFHANFDILRLHWASGSSNIKF